MRPRWTLSFVIVFLLVLGVAWSSREVKTMGKTALSMPGQTGGVLTETMAERVESRAETGAPATLVAGGRSAGGSVKRVATIGAGAAALLAEEIELRALGSEVALSLTEREWSALAGVTLNTQAVRHAYEAEIAVATVREDGRQRLEIPAYVEAGAVLRREFYMGLLKELGAPMALEIVQKLSDRLESRFAGFGAAVQTLEFSGLAAGHSPDGATVTRTVVFWDESNAGEASRKRSDTIFPQMEDPDGLQWGALLARVGAAHAYAKKSRG